MNDRPIRYCRAKGHTADEMRAALHSSPLYQLGDAALVWVNEGDFWLTEPRPVDVDSELAERRRQDAILAEADAIRAQRAAAG